MNQSIIWLPSVKKRLLHFRSEHFTPEETLNFIRALVLDTERLLGDKLIHQAYTEEFGRYKGFSRIVIKKFRIYYDRNNVHVIILAILYPGQI